MLTLWKSKFLVSKSHVSHGEVAMTPGIRLTDRFEKFIKESKRERRWSVVTVRKCMNREN